MAGRKKGTKRIERLDETMKEYVAIVGSSQEQYLWGERGKEILKQDQGQFFNELKTRLKKDIPTFGRTTTFDYLERLGRLRLLGQDFLPNKMYLENSSGPLFGFSLVMTGSVLKERPFKKWLMNSEISAFTLDELGIQLQEHVLNDPKIATKSILTEKSRPLVEVLADPRNFETSLCCFYEWGNRRKQW